MEAIVRIVSQSDLITRQYIDKKTGEPQHQYKVQCSMVVREWNSQQTGEAMQATTIYVDKIGLK